MKWLFFVLAAAVALYGLHRLALWMESRGWIYYKHKRASTSTLGNAFLEVQAIVDPGKRHVLEATRQEVVEVVSPERTQRVAKATVTLVVVPRPSEL